jgi:DNA-binding NarL/FixJ family response regulator
MKPIRICIVEDLKELREGLVNLLAIDERFYMMEAFGDAETAVQQLYRWQPDVVIMDINLPGMNGIECIKKVKATLPNTQFMMFTIYESDEKVFDALVAGASGYLLKKTPLSKISEALIELYEGGAPMSMQIARKVLEKMRTGEPAASSEELTTRENEVLQCLSRGLLYKEIAIKLNIAIGTVRQHIHSIYEKLHVTNRTEALNKTLKK